MNFLHLMRSYSLWQVKSLDMQGHLLFSVFHEKMWKFLACAYALCNYNNCFCVRHLWDEQPKVLEIKTFFIYLKFLNVFFVKIKCETALIVHTLGWLWYAVAKFLQFAWNFFCFLPDQKKEKKLACLKEGRNGWRRWWCSSPLHSLIK
jgi:hypothetical protein